MITEATGARRDGERIGGDRGERSAGTPLHQPDAVRRSRSDIPVPQRAARSRRSVRRGKVGIGRLPCRASVITVVWPLRVPPPLATAAVTGNAGNGLRSTGGISQLNDRLAREGHVVMGGVGRLSR